MANTNNAAFMRMKKQQKLKSLNMIEKLRKDQTLSGSSSYGIVSKMQGLLGKQATSRSDHYGSYSSSHYEECDNGISLCLLLTALAALAVMFYTLYTKVKISSTL